MNQRGNRPPQGQPQQGSAAPAPSEGGGAQTEQAGQAPAAQTQGGQRKKKQSSKPNLSQAALAGATPLSTFGELAAFWEAKKKEGEQPAVQTAPPPEEGQAPPA